MGASWSIVGISTPHVPMYVVHEGDIVIMHIDDHVASCIECICTGITGRAHPTAASAEVVDSLDVETHDVASIRASRPLPSPRRVE